MKAKPSTFTSSVYPLAALYLVGGACAAHRSDILSAGGGGDRERLRRVPRPHGDHRQAQRRRQRGAGNAPRRTPTTSFCRF